MSAVALFQQAAQIFAVLHRKAPAVHLRRRFRQFVGLVNDERLIVFEQPRPFLLPVRGVCQQKIVVTNLDGNAPSVGFFQIFSVAAASPRRAAFWAMLRHTNQAAVKIGKPLGLIQIQIAAYII